MKQKEIWIINLDPTIGSEIRKKRPCVILNNDAIGILPLKIIAPVTDYKEKYDVVPWMVKLAPNNTNQLKKKSVVDIFQVRSLSQERFVEKIGDISEDELEKCKRAIKIAFDIY